MLTAYCLLLVSGCATPQYAVHPAPTPDESPQVRTLEQTISAAQARDLERQGVRPVQFGERLFGFDLQGIVNALSRVTERPYLTYRVLLLQEQDPNAVSLADGRVYVTTGMLRYLASRGSRESELAFVLAHELGHTMAQHLVKRYQELQQQQAVLALVGMGASIAAQRGPQGEAVGGLAQDVASLISNVVVSGYSQEQELEADQLGVRYCIRAGYDPKAALALLEDFSKFETPSPFLRTHPYSRQRAQDLERYLTESGVLAPSAAASSPPIGVQRAAPPIPNDHEETRRRLLEAQRLYPVGSQSWKNIQQQLDELSRR